GGTSGSLGSNSVTNNAALVFNRSDSITVANAISGTGSVSQNGTGTLTLSGANAYSGGTNLNAGTVNVSADNNLGATTGPLTFNGGTLQLGASFNLSSTRAITLNAGGGSIDTNGFSTTISQAIAGGGALTKTGIGTLTLTGNNSYSGVTT